MAFQIKDFTSIVASMINWMKSTQSKVTDFNVGSVVRTVVEAPASEIDELYQQMHNGLKEAIPAATYFSFDFDALPALPATGMVRVTIASNASDVLISSGTTVSYLNGDIDYTVNQDVIIPAGDTFADVLVTAATAGAAGNVAAGTQFTLSPAPTGFVSATNLSPWSNGTDAETEDDRKLRFRAFVQSLNRGTVAALEYGLKTTSLTDASGNVTERVVSASIVEPWKDIDSSMPISLVECYIHNGVGSTSSVLVNRAREVIYGYYDSSGKAVPGWKAAGVKVEVYAAVEQTVDVIGDLTALPGYDKPTLVTQATEAVYAYIQGLEIGAPAILSEIIAIIMDIEGVYNFVPSAPTADTTVDKKTKLMPGAITIT
ncbi:baseplate J-like protein [Bordetella phage vB_BbrM_PHB04]|uniref:Baseplate J-like protein n=1 Tax=Bordetella phage vB_BbrM_PHB04 TaxID=2029657 RepID=A0A291L9V0_9CAUD|nr:baseplate J-like protein [Bordetella phage vB_BbrM_PHB04]ATI15621.1 baseplate J-like protein [Bordetella phage vB_BbrM_PHB04]